MNILTVSHPGIQFRNKSKFRHGGFEPFVRLAQRGHKIFNLTSINNNESSYDFFRGVHIYRCKPLFQLKQFGYTALFPFSTLRRIVKEHDIDLINGRGLQSTNTLCAGIFSQFFSSTPFALTLLGFSKTTGNSRLDIFANLYDYTFGKFLANSSKKVIVLGNELVKRATKLEVPLKKIVICPPGIDIKRFNPKTYDLSSKQSLGLGNSFVIGFVGRFVPLKGIIDLILASKIVAKQYPIHILLVGDGPLRRVIENKINSLGIPFTITGWVDNPEIYYSAMDIFILPSYSEGFPRTCLEAMAMEKTLIVTDVGANKEIVRDGVNGFLVNPGNPKILAEKLIMLIENKYLLEEWGRINRNIVEKNYTLEKEVKTLENIFYNILKIDNHACV